MVKRKGEQRVSTGYKPRPLQAKLHASLKRFNVLVCHRRFGKTVFSISEMLDKGLRNPLHNPQYAYIAPTYKQAKMIAWEYLKDFTKDIPGYEANKQELTVTIHRQGVKKNGKWIKKPDKIRYMLLGADNPDSIRGIYLDGSVIDEFAQCDPIVWGEVVRPTLADRAGWVIFIGTPKGQNHFYNRYNQAISNPSWFTVTYRASETGVIDREELIEMKMDMEKAEYEQEMECSFEAAMTGSYYGSIITNLEDHGHVGDFPYDPAFPVDTYWDIGMHDAMSLWFRQKVPGGKKRYIEYLEVEGKSLIEMCKILKELPYLYGRHVLPWDANVRDLGTGKTRLEVVKRFLKGVEIQKRQKVDERIQATRHLLPNCYFHQEKCQKGLNSLKNYQKEYDSKVQMFKNKPKHDWTSHGADSFGYSALDDRESRFSDSFHDDLPREAEMDYNELGGIA